MLLHDVNRTKESVLELLGDLQLSVKDHNKLAADMESLKLHGASLQAAFSTSPTQRGPQEPTLGAAGEFLAYATVSIARQLMWLDSYAARFKAARELVFNAVAQTDAMDGMKIAEEMRKDSMTMRSITILTMLFLPATFTTVSSVPAPLLLDTDASVGRRF